MLKFALEVSAKKFPPPFPPPKILKLGYYPIFMKFCMKPIHMNLS